MTFYSCIKSGLSDKDTEVTLDVKNDVLCFFVYSLCSSSQLCNRLWETFHQQHFAGKGVFVYPLPLRLSHGGRSPFFLSLCWERFPNERAGVARPLVLCPAPSRLSDALIIRLPSIPSHTPHSAAAPIWPAFYPSFSTSIITIYLSIRLCERFTAAQRMKRVGGGLCGWGACWAFEGTRSNFF